MAKRMLFLLILIAISIPALLLISRSIVQKESRWRLYDDAQFIPYNTVALVLGCSPRLSGGRTNLFFKYRIDAAVQLYEVGKIAAFVVSGDNSTHQYDEPTAMKEALIERGIPAEIIYCDYAGFRTLDSVVRSREIFGQHRITIVSQPFHNRRAIFLASKRGIEAVGYNAAAVGKRAGFRTQVREWFARTKAVLDIYVLNRQPRFFGPPIEIEEL